MPPSIDFPKATYRYAVHDQQALVEFDGAEKYTIPTEGTVFVSGTHTVNGNEIILIDQETKIPGLPTQIPGRYRWNIESDTLLLSVIDDPVGGRSKLDFIHFLGREIFDLWAFFERFSSFLDVPVFH